MNIWIFNHYAQSPDLPGGTRHFDLSKELSNRGYNVTIFASGYHYTLLEDIVEYNEHGYKIENKDGITFVWIKTFPYKTNNWKRMVNIISYALRLNSLIPKLNLKKPDEIIGSTVHPFTPIIASKIAQQNNIPFIYEIRDLWPQTFIDMKIWKKNSFIANFFKWLEKLSVKRAYKIIVLSPLTVEYLQSEYQYQKDKILLLPNGVSDNFISSIKHNKKEKIDITYIGGIDKVHGLEFLIDLANALKDELIIFNIYGDGKEKQYLKEKVKEYQLSNVLWHNPIPKLEVPKKLEQADLLFVSTANVLYGSENKLYEYMATGKPLVIAAEGDHNNPVSKINCGVSLNRQNLNQAADNLKCFIKNEKDNFIFLGQNGQNFVLQHRMISILGKKLDIFLKEIDV